MSTSERSMLAGIQPKANRKTRRRIARENRNNGKAASYARYSSEMQNESSNDDQHRRIEEEAHKNEHTVAPPHRYSDSAVSGTKIDREGLNQLIKDAESGEFGTIYFYSLSRLARESLIGMSILKKLVRNHGLRIISVSDGIDTDRDGWEMHANMLFMFYEKFLEQLAADVLKAQEGVVLGGQSVGDHRFGYTSTPIPNAPLRGKGKKPPKQYGINEQEAEWVVAIFRWFVEKKLSITKIVKILNNRKVPKGHRAQKSYWIRENVISILESTKYVGLWPWGQLKNHRDPETGKVWQEPRDEKDRSDEWMRYRPDLQIVEVELFKSAQERLKQNRETNDMYRNDQGQFNSKRGSRGNPPCHLLSGLLKCSGCGHVLYLGGAGGKYLFCPNYRRGTCKCRTSVRKDLATRLILQVIANTIKNDEEWLAETYRSVLRTWEIKTSTVPGEIVATERAIEATDNKIGRLLDRIENGNLDMTVEKRLRERQQERCKLLTRLAELRRNHIDKPDPPTLGWVRNNLERLLSDSDEFDPATIEAIHGLLGGELVVQEIRPHNRRRFLRGHLTLRISDATRLILGMGNELGSGDTAENSAIIVDFVEPDPLVGPSDRAKAMYDLGKMNAEIASDMGVSRSMVTKLLRFWFESRGLEMPDGRSRRSTLERKHMEEPYYQQIADKVQALLDQGLLIAEVAMVVGCDINTVRSASQHWHKSRGLEYLDGRSRRKSLDRKSRD